MSDCDTDRILSLPECVFRHGLSLGNASAIVPLIGEPITYDELSEFVHRTGLQFRSAGLGKSERIAIVMPNGPEMTLAVSTVAAWCVCVPLNPELADRDWPHYFEQLQVRRLLYQGSLPEAAQSAAVGLGIGLIELTPDHNRNGRFSLKIEGPGDALADELPGLDDIMLVLPTSGTTALPKSVPLTHRNISHSAWNTIGALELTSTDRLLAVLPLYHAVGLIAGLMTTLTAGASIICPGRFEVDTFYSALVSHKPSWYTAVPTIHDAIIAGARRHSKALKDHSLRLVRSSGASLPPQRFGELEALFGVPLIEAYGMTESSSQIASNPLPPGRRKVGSVGVAAGPDIRILTELGDEARMGETGEIAIQGPILTPGYDGDEGDLAEQMTDGWFRTGDLGYLDDDGYLFVVGRSKELIIRGGENISPRKIDEVLLDHPDVLEAVTYSVPHSRLGEEIEAAVVLKTGKRVSSLELRTFALNSRKLRLSELPRLVKVVRDIPKSGSGKIQRIRIASLLREAENLAEGLDAEMSVKTTVSRLERRLSEVWSEEFGGQTIGPDDDFFVLGGDSLMAIRIAIRIRDLFNCNVDLKTLFERPSVRKLAQYIDSQRPSSAPAIFRHPSDMGRQEGSISQQMIYSNAQLHPGYPVYNLMLAFRLRGELDTAALLESVRAVVRRHQSLRATFGWSDGLLWLFDDAPAEVNLESFVEDWTLFGEDAGYRFVQSTLSDAAWAPFDLTAQAPIRFRLLQISDEVSIFAVIAHHIISDGWSTDILLREISANYSRFKKGVPIDASVPDIDFSDFASFQRNWAEGREGIRQVEFWSGYLAGSENAGRTDKPLHGSFKTGRLPVVMNPDLLSRAEKMAKEQETTLFVVILAAFKLVASRAWNNQDICVATPAANRSWVNSETIVGLVENTIIVRTLVPEEQTLKQVIASVKRQVLLAQEHQEFPFESLMQKLIERGDLESYPSIDLYFSLTNKFGASLQLPEVETDPFIDVGLQAQPVMPHNRSSLMLMLNETERSLIGSLAYDKAVLDDEFVTTLLGDLRALFAHEPEAESSLVAEPL